MKSLRALLLPCLLATTLTYASSGAGNGGDALICHNSPDYGDKVLLLDSHEAKKRKLNINLDNSNGATPTHRSMVNMAISRLMKKDVATAEKLYNYAMEMVNDLEKLEMYPDARGKVLYIGNDVVGEINDSLHVTVPIGCEIRQLVSQKTPKYRLDFRYEINKAIWDQMDLVEQSMTILHEAWYRIMIENDTKDEHNSYGARYINGLVASEQFEADSFANYVQDLKETEMRNYEVINNSSALIGEKISVPLKDSQIQLEEDMVCVSNINVPAQIKKFGVRGWFRGIRTLKVNFVKFCFKNSKVVSLELPKEITNEGFLLSMENYQISVNSGTSSENSVMQFHPNGKLSHITNIDIEFLVKMYYKCGRRETFERGNNCSGPYRLNETKIMNPGDVFFSMEDESPVGFDFPSSMETPMARRNEGTSINLIPRGIFEPQRQQQQQAQVKRTR